MKLRKGLSRALLCLALLGLATSAGADSWDQILAAARGQGALVGCWVAQHPGTTG